MTQVNNYEQVKNAAEELPPFSLVRKSVLWVLNMVNEYGEADLRKYIIQAERKFTEDRNRIEDFIFNHTPNS